MAFTYTWDEDFPAVGNDANEAHEHQFNDKRANRERIAVEHHAPTGDDTDTWRHSAGSGRVRYGVAGSRPASDATNTGSIYISTDTGATEYSDGAGNWISFGGGGGLYSGGTVDVTQTSTGVEGNSTDFTLVNAGDIFWLSGATRYYGISSITDADTIVLTAAYEGSNGNAQSYFIGRVNLSQQFLPRSGGTLFETTLGSALAAGSFLITGLGAASSNGEALRYEHSQAATIDHPDASVTLSKLGADVDMASWALGSYEGTGSGQTINASLDLTSGTYFGMIWALETGQSGSSLTLFHSSDTSGYSLVVRENYVNDAVTAPHATGFTLGTRADVNANNKTYAYVVVKFS